MARLLAAPDEPSSNLSDCEAGAGNALLLWLDLNYVNHIVIRISLYDKRDVLILFALQCFGVIHLIALAVLVTRNALATD
jgi:hypothetical protein